jgi:hypothetical protein
MNDYLLTPSASFQRPSATELPQALEPVSRDPFIDGLGAASPAALKNAPIDAWRSRELS